MKLRSATGSLVLLLAPWLVLSISTSPASAQTCVTCQTPPVFRPKPVCNKCKFGRHKQACNQCDLANYGYFPTCWHPWPFPPNYDHCPMPAMTVFTPPQQHTPYLQDKLHAPKALPALPNLR